MNELRTETRPTFQQAKEFGLSGTEWQTIIEDYHNQCFIITEESGILTDGAGVILGENKKVIATRSGKFFIQRH